MTGRVYGWQIEPLDDTTCDLTNYCDWHANSDEMRARAGPAGGRAGAVR